MISGDMLIGDIVQKYPHAVQIFLSYGLHCVGCQASPHESIQQGAVGHGIPEPVVQKMIKEINDTIPDDKPLDVKEGEVIVNLTEKAAIKAKELMKEDNKEGFGLRVGVVAGGCSGYSYQLEFEDREKPGDLVYEQFGLKVYINEEQAQHVKGMDLDYENTLNQQGFKFSNPNAVQTCGCGSSFGV